MTLDSTLFECCANCPPLVGEDMMQIKAVAAAMRKMVVIDEVKLIIFQFATVVARCLLGGYVVLSD